MSSAPRNETKRSHGEFEDMTDFPDISSPTSAAAGEYTLPHRLRSGMTETTTSSGANAVFNETVQPVESQQNPASSLQLLPHRPKIVTTDEASHTLPDGQVKRESLDDISVSTENLRDEHEINQRKVIGRHALRLQQRRARGKPAPIPSNYDILLQQELPTPEHEVLRTISKVRRKSKDVWAVLQEWHDSKDMTKPMSSAKQDEMTIFKSQSALHDKVETITPPPVLHKHTVETESPANSNSNANFNIKGKGKSIGKSDSSAPQFNPQLYPDPPELRSEREILRRLWSVRGGWLYMHLWTTPYVSTLLRQLHNTWHCLNFRIACHECGLVDEDEEIYRYVGNLQNQLHERLVEYRADSRLQGFSSDMDIVIWLILDRKCSH